MGSLSRRVAGKAPDSRLRQPRRFNMGDGFQFIDIILLAMVAAFIVLRLRSVLGRRTGNERQRPDAGSPSDSIEIK